MNNKTATQLALWTALLLALAGSIRHVAWAFATLEAGNMTWGYVQAAAVDIGLTALAYAIQQRRRERRGTRTLWLGVLVFSGISAYANLLHGMFFASDIGLDGWTLARPFLLSAVLPLLVLYLSEIISSDVQHAYLRQERGRQAAARAARRQQAAARKQAAHLSKAAEPSKSDTKTATLSKSDAKAVLLDTLRTQPDAKSDALAAAIGRSRSTMYNYLDELVQAGQVSRNGGGIVVR